MTTITVTPELYDRAAEVAETCGWTDGDLLGICPTITPAEELKIIDHDDETTRAYIQWRARDEGGSVPCCVNGHLMLAAGHLPSYQLYDRPDYVAVVDEVLKTIADGGDEFGFVPTQYENHSKQLERWNDRQLRNVAATRRDAQALEVKLLRATAARLRG